MKIITSARLASLLATLAVAACSDDDNGPDPLPASCETAITAADADGFVQLCEVDGGARHVVIANVVAPATHSSAQVVFGSADAPASPQAALGADQFRVLLYGGGIPAPAPLVQATWGDQSAALDGDAAFLNATGTVCFDIHDGSSTTAPAFILWVDGLRGADCGNPATLTGASAYGARTYWHGNTGTINKATRPWFRQSSGTGATPTVTVSNAAVLSAADIAAATTCTTTWAENTDWQPLCAPATGIARHVRIDAARAAANNNYFYAVLGQDAGPAGNPAPSAGKLIVTGGRSNSGASWTWFRFDDGSTTQFNYATDAASAFYTDNPTTICFDLGSTDEGNARFVFWGTGAGGADCGVATSLALDNVLYDSTTDPATASIWDVPFITGAFNFIKSNNVGAGMTSVTVSSEPFAL